MLAEFEGVISSNKLPPLSLMKMVRQHLAFSGMHATLQALDKQVTAAPAVRCTSDVDVRVMVLLHVML